MLINRKERNLGKIRKGFFPFTFEKDFYLRKKWVEFINLLHPLKMSLPNTVILGTY